jgi:hypothetical protein
MYSLHHHLMPRIWTPTLIQYHEYEVLVDCLHQLTMKSSLPVKVFPCQGCAHPLHPYLHGVLQSSFSLQRNLMEELVSKPLPSTSPSKLSSSNGKQWCLDAPLCMPQWHKARRCCTPELRPRGRTLIDNRRSVTRSGNFAPSGLRVKWLKVLYEGLFGKQIQQFTQRK